MCNKKQATMMIQGLRALGADTYWPSAAWAAVIDQDVYWVPAPSWRRYVNASMRVVRAVPVAGGAGGQDVATGPAVMSTCFTPHFDVPGVMKVEDMSVDYRRNALEFLWGRSRGICKGLALSSIFTVEPFDGPVPEEVVDGLMARDQQYMDMAEDTVARRRWFDASPLVRALKRQGGPAAPTGSLAFL